MTINTNIKKPLPKTRKRLKDRHRLWLALTAIFMAFIANAKDFAWVCAIERSEKKPEWVFVYEDIKLQSDGTYRVFVKWEFDNNDPKMHSAKQVWLLSPDFDKTHVVSSVGYNDKGEVVYTENNPYGAAWKYVLPDTNAEAVVETVKELLLSK